MLINVILIYINYTEKYINYTKRYIKEIIKLKIYNKLVRDKIPQIIEKDNCNCKIHIANDLEYTKELEKKLMEETQEYITDKNLEELADIMEVICALAENLGFTEKDLFNKRNEKNSLHGGFKDRIILEKTYK